MDQKHASPVARLRKRQINIGLVNFAQKEAVHISNHPDHLAAARERGRLARIRRRSGHRSDHQALAQGIETRPETARRGLANDDDRSFRVSLFLSESPPLNDRDAERLKIIRYNVAVACRWSLVFASLAGWWLCAVNPNRHKPVSTRDRRTRSLRNRDDARQTANLIHQLPFHLKQPRLAVACLWPVHF